MYILSEYTYQNIYSIYQNINCFWYIPMHTHGYIHTYACENSGRVHIHIYAH